MEWSETNVYNSFNSMKGLTYYEHYRKIMAWMNKETDAKLPPPREVSIDPITSCNLECYYCNSQRYLRKNPNEIPANRRVMKKQYMRDLIRFLAKWGVEGFCFGGGGESLLHPAVHTLPAYVASLGKQSAVVTNGTVMNFTLLKELCYCRWVGFSVCATDAETYTKVHGEDMFVKVIDNIRQLVVKRKEEGGGFPRMDIAFKFLILPENYTKIYEACKLAKDLGVQDFHVRPVDLERKDYRGEPFEFPMEVIEDEFRKCHELATEDFRVHTVTHKYDARLQVSHKFSRCLASPLVIQCCTDGKVYICVDHRNEGRFCIGEHYPNPEKIKEWWGNENHREVVNSIRPHEECSRCTWSEYNRQIEKVIPISDGGRDSMCVNFP